MAFLGLELRADPVAIDLEGVLDGRRVDVGQVEAFVPESQQLGFAPGAHSGKSEDRGPRRGGRRKHLSEFVALVNAGLRRLADAGTFAVLEELGRVDALPLLAALRVAEDLRDGAEDLRDRLFGVPGGAELADELGDVVGSDRVELSLAPSRVEMLVDVVRMRLAGLIAKCGDRAGEALAGHRAEPQLGVGLDRLTRITRCEDGVSLLRAAVIPPRTVIQRNVPLASRAPISNVPSAR